jgi:hypothetical protein
MLIYCQLGVALNLLKQIPDMPLAHKSKSDGVQPLYALACVLCSLVAADMDSYSDSFTKVSLYYRRSFY